MTVEDEFILPVNEHTLTLILFVHFIDRKNKSIKKVDVNITSADSSSAPRYLYWRFIWVEQGLHSKSGPSCVHVWHQANKLDFLLRFGHCHEVKYFVLFKSENGE